MWKPTLLAILAFACCGTALKIIDVGKIGILFSKDTGLQQVTIDEKFFSPGSRVDVVKLIEVAANATPTAHVLNDNAEDSLSPRVAASGEELILSVRIPSKLQIFPEGPSPRFYVEVIENPRKPSETLVVQLDHVSTVAPGSG